MSKIWVGLIFIISSLACSARSAPPTVICPHGSIVEADLSKGELLLNGDDVIKIRTSDQSLMNTLSKGRTSFPASPKNVSDYELHEEHGWHWIVALSGGLFGRDLKSAQAYFMNGASINASYYPSTHKLVVSSVTPHIEGALPFGFWVFVRAPNEVQSVTYDCGAFK